MKLTRFKPCVGYDGEAGMMLSEDGGWLLAEHVEAAIAALEGTIAERDSYIINANHALNLGIVEHEEILAELASAKQRVGELEEALKMAAIRLEILTGRMRGCHEETGNHGLLFEAEDFCKEARAALANKE